MPTKSGSSHLKKKRWKTIEGLSLRLLLSSQKVGWGRYHPRNRYLDYKPCWLHYHYHHCSGWPHWITFRVLHGAGDTRIQNRSVGKTTDFSDCSIEQRFLFELTKRKKNEWVNITFFLKSARIFLSFPQWWPLLCNLEVVFTSMNKRFC